MKLLISDLFEKMNSVAVKFNTNPVLDDFVHLEDVRYLNDERLQVSINYDPEFNEYFICAGSEKQLSGNISQVSVYCFIHTVKRQTALEIHAELAKILI